MIQGVLAQYLPEYKHLSSAAPARPEVSDYTRQPETKVAAERLLHDKHVAPGENAVQF
jgi:hypothetical protein